MLNIKLECSRDYFQHFQSYNSCVPELSLNTKSNHSCSPELTLNTKFNHSCALNLALNTKSHHSCTSGITPNTLYKSIMHSLFCTLHHNNHLSICIKVNFRIHPVHRTKTIIFVHQGPCPTYTIAYMIIKTYALAYTKYI